MKHFLKILLLSLALLLLCAGVPKPKYWYCGSVGVVNYSKQGDKITMVISDIHKNDYSNYKKRQNAFGKLVEETLKSLPHTMEKPHCIDYDTKKQATESLRLALEQARRLKFRVMYLNFEYNPWEGTRGGGHQLGKGP